MPAPTIWSDDRITALRKLFAEGVSSSLIAEKLNRTYGTGFSRNAVIGRLHRLGLRRGREKPSVARLYPIAVARSNAAKMNAAKKAPKPPKAAKPAPEPIPDPPPVKDAVAMLDLKLTHCRWPVFGEGADTLFCGARAVRASWCAHHADKGFVPPSPKRATANQLMRSLRRYAA